MLSNWNWQTKDNTVATLISTLLKIDDEYTSSRIEVVLVGNYGYLTAFFSNQNQQYNHHQYDVYNSRSVSQRYQELLKGLCAIPRVQEHVQEKAAEAAADDTPDINAKRFMWLHEQIKQLLIRGQLDPSYLINELRHTAVVVSGAGEEAVNGTYRFSKLREYNSSLYKRETMFRDKKVFFQIYRCRMDNKAYQWFISIVPAGKDPGTNADEDFYCKLSHFRPPNSHAASMSKTLYDGGEIDIKPPEGEWSMVNHSKACKLKPPPRITWVTISSSSDVEIEEDEEEGEEDEWEREDCMAVVDDDDRYAVDDIDDDDV